MQNQNKKTKIFLVLFLSFIMLYQIEAEEKQKLQIVPEPVSITEGNGKFIFDKSVILVVDTTNVLLENSAYLFLETIKRSTGLKLQVRRKAANQKSVSLILNSSLNQVFGNEAYVLEVTSNTIKIEAITSAGIFYGLQTLLKLFPPQIESKEAVWNTDWSVPGFRDLGNCLS